MLDELIPGFKKETRAAWELNPGGENNLQLNGRPSADLVRRRQIPFDPDRNTIP